MTKSSAKTRADQVREWYEQYGPALVAYASSILGERSSAEDALQQVFLKLLRGAMELPSPARPYLFSAVRNAALSMTRKSRRDVPLADEAGPDNKCEQWFQAPAELGYWSAKLEGAIRELPQEQGEVLIMRIWGEMSFDEIATVLAISINTVASRYRYALAKLRERMQPLEVGNEHTAK
ncbi:MAG TPA: RNA polymerase sigma factor [Candidatus Saccharimonadales bacterium]|jgi:RNA polymerase sigma factor (sigma-70 family)|nr:RNA polymerase sigma factor [Candidatus Saccharimonadales bacterium]